MGRLYTFLLGVVVGFGLYHAALHFHVVYAADGLHLIAKQPPRLAEMYVDVRQFGWADWQKRPALLLAIQKSGKPHILGDAARNAAEGVIQRGLEKLRPDAQR